MKDFTYQNKLIDKKQLRELLSWSFSNYDSMEACALADKLKYLGFRYASHAGISISLEDLRIPFIKNNLLKYANQQIRNANKMYLRGKITDLKRFQRTSEMWSHISDSLKEQVVFYFKTYDPLNSLYIMAFSGARGNLSQVRQLVGMRGLMSNQSGEILKVSIKKNFREGLTVTDYLISGYGARKGIIDTALKTANSGYLTRRLIDVGQDILIRDKDCLTIHSLLFSNDLQNQSLIYEKLIGRVLNKSILNLETEEILANKHMQITSQLITKCLKKNVDKFYIRSPLTCTLYRAICQKCYGWDLANQNLVEMGEAVGILAGQSIGEPGTQLTMRTFHTGGVSSGGPRSIIVQEKEKLMSPATGILKFSTKLKIAPITLNNGEDVILTKNSGDLFIIPKDKTKPLTKILILRNTVLFFGQNDYVVKNTAIGQMRFKTRNAKTEVKPIINEYSGETFMPLLKSHSDSFITNKLMWIFSGQVYKSPLNSFINFSCNYKLDINSSIFRTKIISHYKGYVKAINKSEKSFKILNDNYLIPNCNLKKIVNHIWSKNSKNYLLNYKNLQYLIKITNQNYIKVEKNKPIGVLITTAFKTLTGGKLYYSYKFGFESHLPNKNIEYLPNKNINFNKWFITSNFKEKFFPIEGYEKNKKYLPLIQNYKNEFSLGKINHRTIIWIEEETHKVKYKLNNIFVKPGDFIYKNFQLFQDVFSKISGIVSISKKNDFQIISIKYGSVYKGKIFKKIFKKIYYPGEVIFSNILINKLSVCENIVIDKTKKLLIRPIEIYEIPYNVYNEINISNKEINNENILFESNWIYPYRSSQVIRSNKNLNLIFNVLNFKTNKFCGNNIKIKLVQDKKIKSLNLKINKKFILSKYLIPSLKYKTIESCILPYSSQFIDSYTVLGYLESVTSSPQEIVQFKIKTTNIKEICLISNNDCSLIKKSNFPFKKIGDLIVYANRINNTGKIILETKHFFILQKGRSYFFPNCINEKRMKIFNVKYKFIPYNKTEYQIKTNRFISLNFLNLTKISLKNTKIPNFYKSLNDKIPFKIEFSKFFIEKDNKLYSLLTPQFLKRFSLTNSKTNLKTNLKKIITPQELKYLTNQEIYRNVLIRNSKLNNQNYGLTLVKFSENSAFSKSNKSIGFYAITESFFEEEGNELYCKGNTFIENGDIIGFANVEIETNDDIVQGLPKIEQMLEARKKKLESKRIPIIQQKGLLVQKTNLDLRFNFKKLGVPIKENQKINPHKLLKIYFNYYGAIKIFTCYKRKKLNYNRLMQNHESSYKSFKKVQLFILNSVQSIYKSQGVSINDKHLELIIQQMTTRVLVTHQGHTSLLIYEVIDLYHMKHINEIVKMEGKKSACYIPVLFGITKAALSSPSFISAASFQETVRVLTKASIEGRLDWLRGLKENIVIGHLIPAGTGFPDYKISFRKK
uniref:DNA-directed RNA polymerase n=1 Tax=Climaconeis sp. TaxID=2846830 RepID=A0A8F8SQQ4_9STRA|nr:RNA polymerase beta'' subunit [Climaconeis sp.]